jgi:hypothetical protein
MMPLVLSTRQKYFWLCRIKATESLRSKMCGVFQLGML